MSGWDSPGPYSPQHPTAHIAFLCTKRECRENILKLWCGTQSSKRLTVSSILMFTKPAQTFSQVSCLSFGQAPCLGERIQGWHREQCLCQHLRCPRVHRVCCWPAEQGSQCHGLAEPCPPPPISCPSMFIYDSRTLRASVCIAVFLLFTVCEGQRVTPDTVLEGVLSWQPAPSPPGCSWERCSQLVFLTSSISSPNSCLNSGRRHTDLSLGACKARVDKCI